MNWLRRPTELAAVCAGCHVGAAPQPDGLLPIRRDVNHDLIAAGHPPMRFEFGTYLAHLPRHWSDYPGRPGDPARYWVVGQAVASAAAFELLAGRAESCDAPWPEFAAFACASCHQQVGGVPSRQGSEPLGRPRLSSWNHGRMDWLADLHSSPTCGLLPDAIGRVAGRTDGRDRAGLGARQAARAARELAERIAATTFDDAHLDRLVAALAGRSGTLTTDEWDDFCHAVLGLAAVNRSRPGDRRQDKLVEELLRLTVFPPGNRGPSGESWRSGVPARKARLAEFR